MENCRCGTCKGEYKIMIIKSNYSRKIELDSDERKSISTVRAILDVILDIMRKNKEKLYVEYWDEYEEYDVMKLANLISQIEKFSTIKLIKESDEEL